MRDVRPGNQVIARSADGRHVPLRAVTGVVEGDDFLVVWVCREEEWLAARAQRRRPNAIPWPADDVRVANTKGAGVAVGA